MQQGSDILTWIKKPYVPISHGLFFPTDWVLHLWGNTPAVRERWPMGQSSHEDDKGLGLAVGSQIPHYRYWFWLPPATWTFQTWAPDCSRSTQWLRSLRREKGWRGQRWEGLCVQIIESGMLRTAFNHLWQRSPLSSDLRQVSQVWVSQKPWDVGSSWSPPSFWDEATKDQRG